MFELKWKGGILNLSNEMLVVVVVIVWGSKKKKISGVGQ